MGAEIKNGLLRVLDNSHPPKIYTSAEVEAKLTAAKLQDAEQAALYGEGLPQQKSLIEKYESWLKLFDQPEIQ